MPTVTLALYLLMGCQQNTGVSLAVRLENSKVKGDSVEHVVKIFHSINPHVYPVHADSKISPILLYFGLLHAFGHAGKIVNCCNLYAGADILKKVHEVLLGQNVCTSESACDPASTGVVATSMLFCWSSR